MVRSGELSKLIMIQSREIDLSQNVVFALCYLSPISLEVVSELFFKDNGNI